MPSILIDDGFTLDGEIEPRFGFPAVKFKYRMAMPGKVYAYLTEPKLTGEERAAAAAKLLAEHLVEWDAKTNHGAFIPINEINLRRVAHPVLERLLDHVTGYGQKQREEDVKN